MHWHYNPYVLPLAIAAALSFFSAFFIWRRRPAPGAVPFVLLILAAAGWSLGYALELGGIDLPTKVFWAKIQYFGIVTVSAAWLVFVLQYTGREKWLTRRNLALLAIVPLISLLLVWTNDAHGLIWRNIGLDSSGPFSAMDLSYGPWFWVLIVYSYLSLGLGTLLLIQSSLRASRLYRRQAFTLVIGALAPWIGNGLYVFDLSPIPHLDLTPLGYTLTGLTAAWALFRFRLLDIVPVAREAVIENMSDGVIVLDAQNRIVDINPAAQRIIGRPAQEAIGQEAAQVLSDWPDLVERYRYEVIGHEEITLGEGEARHYFDLRISPLHDQHDHLRGRLVVLRDITERKRAERALKRVADDLTQLIDTANAPIFGIDARGKVNEWNQTAVRITQFDKDEVLGHDLVEEFITEDYKVSVKEVLDNALRGIETTNYEFPLYTKDGRRVMVLLNASTRRDAQGNIVGVVGVGQDITELDAYRSEVERVADDLTQLIDTANAPIFGIDAQGKVNEWNQTAVRITGYSRDEVLGHDLVEEFITEDYKESVKEVLDNALAGTETANYEFPLYTKDGRRVMVLLNATTRRDAQGNIVGVVGVGQDITELDAYRSEVERVADDLTQLIDTANAPIFGIDAQGKVNEWNQTAVRITGYSRDEVLGRDLVEEFITEDYKESVKEVLDNALAGTETANFEFPLYTKDGHRVMVLLNATTRRDAQGNIVGVVGVGQDITELDAYRSEVERVADDLTQLIDTANAPIFGIDAKGKVNEWNQTAVRITGYSRDEVLGRDLVEEFITEDYKVSVKEVLDNALAGTETANFEFPLYTKDGRRVMVLLNATTRRDAQGNIVGVVGVGQDITERTRAEEALRERTHDLDERIKELNCLYGISKLIEKPGISLEEIYQGSADLLPLAWQYPEITCARITIGRQEYTTENFRETPWRQVADISVHGKRVGAVEIGYLGEKPQSAEGPFLREERALINAIASRLARATERRRAEEEITRVATELRQFITTANAPIFGVDGNGLVNEWNRKTAELTGYDAKEVLGRNLVEDFITEDYKVSVKEVLDDALVGKETSNFELPLYTKNGKRMELLLNATTRRDVSGNIIGVIGVGQNITQLKEVERMREEFISVASHELRTPLASIMGFTEVLLSGQPGELTPIQREFLDISYESSERLLHLVNDLLNVSRIDADRLQLSFEVLQMERLAASIVEAIKPVADGKGIALSTQVPTQLPSLEGDRKHLEQVMNNLLSNAIKFTAEGGRVMVTLAREDDHVKIGVSDTGIGIRPDELPLLFQKFSRTSSATEGMVEGTGLGLYISKAIVEKHGGRIWAESEPGKGSIFWFILPLQQPEPAIAPSVSQLPSVS